MERQADESVKVRCFFQIAQFNVDYGTNFLFGIGTREDLCVQRGGRWVFKSLFINAWRSQADVPWKGEIKLVGRPSGRSADRRLRCRRASRRIDKDLRGTYGRH